MNSAVPIATRELAFGSEPEQRVQIRVFAPERVADQEWRSRFELSGLSDSTYDKFAFGVDSVQALQLAFEAIRIALDASGEQYRWLGEEELDSGITRSIPLVLPRKYRQRLDRLIDESIEEWGEEVRRIRGASGATPADRLPDSD